MSVDKFAEEVRRQFGCDVTDPVAVELPTGRWWQLSFADGNLPDGSKFLGALMVKAHTFIEAVEVAHAIGANPGGEVIGVYSDDADPPARFTYRLLSKVELIELSAILNPDNPGVISGAELLAEERS